jgi:hypothetical protein
LCHFKFLTMKNTTVGAGAASRYGSGSDQKRRLLAAPAPAPQHWFFGSLGLADFPQFEGLPYLCKYRATHW